MVWPPDGRLVPIEITGVRGASAVLVTSIRQDEPVTGRGSSCADASGTGTSTARVRAERLGGGDGRVYHIAFTADGAGGGQCMGEVTVCVPSRAGRACEDGGALYDSTLETCRSCSDLCAIEIAMAALDCGEDPMPKPILRHLERARAMVARAVREQAGRRVRSIQRFERLLHKLDRVVGTERTTSTTCGLRLHGTLGTVMSATDAWLASSH